MGFILISGIVYWKFFAAPSPLVLMGSIQVGNIITIKINMDIICKFSWESNKVWGTLGAALRGELCLIFQEKAMK